MKAINLLVYKMGRRRGTSTLCTANHFPMSRRHLKSLFFLHVFFILLFLVLFWLFCWGYVGFYHRGKIFKNIESIKKILNKT